MTASSQYSPIAVVGIAAELPSGPHSQSNLDHTQFFEFLLNKRESYEPFPKDRFDSKKLRGSQLGKIVADKGSFLKNIDQFDYTEFGITGKDARAMSPSTRKLVELSFLALLDSGIDYRGRNVGCFASGITHDVLALGNMDEFEARGSFAGIPAQIANRISYHLDLVGPSVPTDTACSSTLSAMHVAVQALRAGDCEAAVVGGCQLNHRFLDFVQYTQGGVLAPDGKCKPFDASANGFSRSEAAVAVVIKPLEDALRDRDKIYATILGTGINSSGSAAPVNAPVSAAQEDAMRRAFAQANRIPQEVDYVELHATGTAAGDPVEANWVGRVFQGESPVEKLLIGSVKGNIGHSEITAFLASLCKVVGIFEHGILPPNANLRRLNPAIHWDKYKLKVPLEPTPLTAGKGKSRMLVSILSSGIGGSNGHCVVESPPPRENLVKKSDPLPVLLVVGALSPRSATVLSDSILSLARQHPDELSALSTLCGRRSRQMPWRNFTIFDPSSDTQPTFSQPVLNTRNKPVVGFVFSGQGPQHIQMGRQLFRDFPVFRKSICSLDAYYTRVTGASLIKTTGLFDPDGLHDVLPDTWPIAIILPSIAIVQVALVDLLRSLGIVPEFVLGHSAGETAMLYASGAASRETVLDIAIARGKALSLTEPLGATMAALSCGVAQAEKLIEEIRQSHSEDILEVACHNSPEAVTVAGHAKAVDSLVALCKSRGVAAQRLRSGVGVHSSAMDLCKDEFYSLIRDVLQRHPESAMTPKVATYSTVTGERIETVLDADYFWRNTRQPVLFSEGMTKAVADHQDRSLTLIEIGPHPALSAYISSLSPSNSSVLCPMRRTKQVTQYHEHVTLLQFVGKFTCAGHNAVNFSALNGGADHLVSFALPPYPFTPKVVSPFSKWTGQDVILNDWNGPLNFPRLRMNSSTHPDLAQHVINGEPIVPATGFIEMALEFGATALWEIKFHSFLSLSHEDPLPVYVDLNGSHWQVQSVVYQGPGVKTTRKLHAEGELCFEPIFNKPAALDIDIVESRLQSMNMRGFYDDFRHFAQYGPAFALIKSFSRGPDEFLVKVSVPRSSDGLSRPSYRLNPAVLDACLHVVVHPLITGTTDKTVYYLPSACKRFFVYSGLDASVDYVYAYGRKPRWTPSSLAYDIFVVDSHGNPICTFKELTVALHAVPKEIGPRYDIVYETLADINPEYLPQETSIESSSPSYILHDQRLYLSFSIGDECSLQRLLYDADMEHLQEIWVLTRSMSSAGAARGFSRSLRREITTFPVRLAEFEGSWTLKDQVDIISGFSGMCIGKEDEFRVTKSGAVLVPRILPVDISPSDAQGSTALLEEGLGLSPSYSNSDEILIHITAVHRDPKSSIWSFVGFDADHRSIAGVTSGPLSGYLKVPKINTIPLSHNAERPFDAYAPYSIPALIACLAFGFTRNRRPRELKGSSVLITHSRTLYGTCLTELCQKLDMQVHLLGESLLDVLQLDQSRFDYIISAHEDLQSQRLLEELCKDAYFWNDNFTGVSSILLGKLILPRELLELSIQLLSLDSPFSSSFSFTPIENLSPEADLSGLFKLNGTLFRGDREYVLIGGIGSVGLRVAVWMYENGARHIALTSRSGRETLLKAKNMPALRMLRYLEGLPGLHLDLIASDASDVKSMQSLVASFQIPIAGCMLFSAVLEDKMFLSQTQDSFERTFAAKTGVLKALSASLDISSLDFVVAFTSISGLFGNAGQTNYASANTALEHMIQEYPNACCIVTPMILDSSIAFAETPGETVRNTKIRHIAEWGVSTTELCQYIERTLRQLGTGRSSLYIPDLNWKSIRENMGSSPMFEHLLPQGETIAQEAGDAASPHAALQDIVCKVLELSPSDFSPDIPLTSYGLDSLSATRLASTLRPYVQVTQMQLLADLTYNDICARANTDSVVNAGTARPEPFEEVPPFDWDEVIRSDKAFVKLSDGEGVPLIMIPGISGRLEVFATLRDTCKSPLYGFQLSSDAPDHSIPDLVEFYFQEMKAVLPVGPYRLAAFCASCLECVLLAQKLIRNGDQVLQVAMLDNFPTFYVSPIWDFDEDTLRDGVTSNTLYRRILEITFDLYRNEGMTMAAARHLLNDLLKADAGEPVRPRIHDVYRNISACIRSHADFVLRFVDKERPYSFEEVRKRFVGWMSQFDFPMTLYVASEGFRNALPNRTPEWDQFGVEMCNTNVRVITSNNTHFTLLSDPVFLTHLDCNGVPPSR